MKSILREKMVEDLQLRGYAERTQGSYTRSVRPLANDWHLPAEEISEQQVRCYLQHVLPHGFTKVRYYGYLSPNSRAGLQTIRELIGRLYEILAPLLPKQPPRKKKPWVCKRCGGPIRWVEFLPPLLRSG